MIVTDIQEDIERLKVNLAIKEKELKNIKEELKEYNISNLSSIPTILKEFEAKLKSLNERKKRIKEKIHSKLEEYEE